MEYVVPCYRGERKFQGSDVFNLSIFTIMPFSFNDVKKKKDCKMCKYIRKQVYGEAVNTILSY